MKKLIFSSLFLLVFVVCQSQVNKTDVLQNLERNQSANQDQKVMATLKSASRLFGEKDDLTTVIMIIPTGSVADVLESDSTYLKIVYDDFEGYIFKRDAILKTAPVLVTTAIPQENRQQVEQPEEQAPVSRFTYLENKYGTNMATRLVSGKIWKGMSAEMVKDSWGTPLKINRVIGNTVKEEWIFKNTWLYIENNRLVEWGPIQR
jgi:hypothetical protein